MIYLIHGENIVDSRRYLLRIKSNYENTVLIKGKNLKEAVFKRTLNELPKPLFGEKTAIEIEQFNGDWGIFPQALYNDLDFILWSDTKIEKIKPGVKSQLFDKRSSVNTFKLTDAILYKNEKEAQLTATELLSIKEPIEKILGTINRGFYLLYHEKDNSLEGENISTFVKKKIKEQAKYWSKSEIKKAVLYLLKADLSVKEGVKPQLALQTFISRTTGV